MRNKFKYLSIQPSEQFIKNVLESNIEIWYSGIKGPIFLKNENF